GLLLPNGGLPWLDQIRAIAQPELGWDNKRWMEETAVYADLWHSHYHLPGRGGTGGPKPSLYKNSLFPPVSSTHLSPSNSHYLPDQKGR
ncbi:MAG: hypothetical protein WAM60_16855, partial [Candidatus Promineifilaceae bacterium]